MPRIPFQIIRDRLSIVLLLLWAGAPVYKNAAAQQASFSDSRRSAEELFERQIRPIFETHCTSCHGPEEPEGGLRLDTADGFFAGGRSGKVVVPGKPEESRVIHLVRGTSDLQMPPDDRLPSEAVAILERWVGDGAVWPGYEVEQNWENDPTNSTDAKFTEEQLLHWAFQPIKDPAPPSV